MLEVHELAGKRFAGTASDRVTGTATLALKLLGEFEVRDSGSRLVNVTARKSRALLALLALAPSCSMTRQRIVDLLWSDRSEAQARSSLRQSLMALRKELAEVGASLFSIGEERVRLNPARIDVDALQFCRLAAGRDTEALREAAALYRGDLLANSDIAEPAFEAWLAAERRRLSDLAIAVFDKLCQHETGMARVELARRLVDLDVTREASHRQLMLAYVEAGERAFALRQYESLRGELRDAFDAAPDRETEALRRRLQLSPVDGAPGSGSPRDGQAEAKTAMAARPEPPGDERPLIAVLPFDASGADAVLEEFCFGLTEEVITALSRIKAMRVIAHDVPAGKRRTVDLDKIGSEVGARYILEGSVRMVAARMRITAHVIDVASGHQVWANRLDRAAADTFDVQDDVTSSIVASVQTQLILSEGSAAAASGTSSTRRLLARSWQQLLHLTAKSLSESRLLAERALAMDDGSGMAHRMIAVALYHQAYMGFIPWTDQVAHEVYEHARISIEAEDADEYSHWAMECAHLLRGEHERAVTSLRRALEINPHCSLAHGSMGTVLAWAGEYDASIERNEFAVRINPDDPSIFFRYFGLALAHYLAGRYDRALAYANKVLEMRSSWWLALIVGTASLARLGRTEEAQRMCRELTRTIAGEPAVTLSMLPFARAVDGEHVYKGLREAGLASEAVAR